MNIPNYLIGATDSESLFPEPTIAQTVFNSALFLVVPALLIFQFCMFIHCLVKPVANKIIWLLVLILLPFLGGILYFFIGRKHQIPPAAPIR